MASADELAALRRAADVTPDDDVYTDALLDSLIDTYGSVAGAASAIWREKAAAYAEMVDTTESGSSRKLSDLHKNALEIAAGFANVDPVVLPSRAAYTIPVERQ